VSLAGISISVALFISVILILKTAQGAFRKPLENAGSDMIVQLQGEPCVWAVVKLPTNLNPIPFKFLGRIRSLNEVADAEGALITWVFPVSKVTQLEKPSQPPDIIPKDKLQQGRENGASKAPCEYGPPGSFCNDSNNSNDRAPVLTNFSPIVVVGVNPEPGELGPITKSDLKNIQGRYFNKEDKFAVILDRDFARTRNLKLEEMIDLGPRVDNKIIGIVNPGYDARIAGAQVFVPLKVAMDMAGRGEIVDIIFIKLKGGVNAGAVEQKIRKVLENDAVTITTSRDYLSSVAGFSILAQGLMLAIFFIVILISFLFIAKTVFWAVWERSSEIGVLKAVGWRNADIIRVVVLENIILGIAAGLIGSLIGYFASFIYKVNLPAVLPYYLNPYPPCSQYLAKNTIQVSGAFPWGVFLAAIMLTVLIQLIFSLMALLRILKLTPAEATRKI